MRLPPWMALIAAFAAAALSGCAIYPGTARPADLGELRQEEGWILLDGVPVVRQASQKGCGAACLAMVLGRWGVRARTEELERECAGPAADGILASDLREAARRRGLAAFLFAGTVADLEHELRRGRPVIVGVAKPDGGQYTAHFEVVVGLHPGSGRVAALDPGIGPTCDSVAGFEAEWARTKGVTLVVFRPEAPVASTGRVGIQGGAR